MEDREQIYNELLIVLDMLEKHADRIFIDGFDLTNYTISITTVSKDIELNIRGQL